MLNLSKKDFLMGLILALTVMIGVTLYCVFHHSDVYFQVIFDSAGGSEVAGQNVLVGDFLEKPSATIKDGYTFKGWYLDGELFDFKTKIRKDLILKAKWEKIKDSTTESLEESSSFEEKIEEEKKEEPKKEEKKNNNVVVPQTPQKVGVISVSLSTANMSLKVGDVSSLSVGIQPDNATNKNVVWSSSNPGVVTVSNGNVRAVGAGYAEIYATVDGKTATCVVQVQKNITYSYQMVDVAASSIGQCMIYIVSSEGQKVSGVITIYYINGTSETLNVPEAGVLKVRDAISSVSVVSVN